MNEQPLLSKFQVGDRVIVYMPADERRTPQFGVIGAVTEYVDTYCTPPRRYTVYTIRLEDGEQPETIDTTEYFVDRYVEMAAQGAGDGVA